MPQLNFVQNMEYQAGLACILTNGTLIMNPFNLQDSISFSCINFYGRLTSNANRTFTVSVGLYSLTGSSLSIANSASLSSSGGSQGAMYFSMTNTSATQNITPGTWYFGVLVSTSGVSQIEFHGGNLKGTPGNAFPGIFVGGILTVSTAVLPVSIATSDFDITGTPEMSSTFILLTA